MDPKPGILIQFHTCGGSHFAVVTDGGPSRCFQIDDQATWLNFCSKLRMFGLSQPEGPSYTETPVIKNTRSHTT